MVASKEGRWKGTTALNKKDSAVGKYPSTTNFSSRKKYEYITHCLLQATLLY